MSSQQWIEVVGWDKFQHYKRRRPLWIKTYTELVTKREYLQLTGAERGLLHGLWMIYALSGGEVPADLKQLNRWLELSAKQVQLESLNHAGFTRVVASKPLAHRDRDIKKRSKTTRKNEEPELLSFDQYLATVAKVKT